MQTTLGRDDRAEADSENGIGGLIVRTRIQHHDNKQGVLLQNQWVSFGKAHGQPSPTLQRSTPFHTFEAPRFESRMALRRRQLVGAPTSVTHGGRAWAPCFRACRGIVESVAWLRCWPRASAFCSSLDRAIALPKLRIVRQELCRYGRPCNNFVC